MEWYIRIGSEMHGDEQNLPFHYPPHFHMKLHIWEGSELTGELLFRPHYQFGCYLRAFRLYRLLVTNQGKQKHQDCFMFILLSFCDTVQFWPEIIKKKSFPHRLFLNISCSEGKIDWGRQTAVRHNRFGHVYPKDHQFSGFIFAIAPCLAKESSARNIFGKLRTRQSGACSRHSILLCAREQNWLSTPE